jgi:hypothetical protein
MSFPSIDPKTFAINLFNENILHNKHETKCKKDENNFQF